MLRTQDLRVEEVVWRSIIEQRAAGTRSVIGAMVESNLNEGQPALPEESG
jgi:phospho-2-dehydro-3-deoxyheptonate aldolase